MTREWPKPRDSTIKVGIHGSVSESETVGFRSEKGDNDCRSQEWRKSRTRSTIRFPLISWLFIEKQWQELLEELGRISYLPLNTRSKLYQHVCSAVWEWSLESDFGELHEYSYHKFRFDSSPLVEKQSNYRSDSSPHYSVLLQAKHHLALLQLGQ